jgi:DNA-binding response OmpR family regulator
MASATATAERKVALVVHDEPALRRLIAAALDEAAFDVIQAADAGAVERELLNPSIDLVVFAESAQARKLVEQLRRMRPALRTLMLTDRREPRADTDAVLHLPFHLDDVREAAIALAFGRCQCASCLRRSRQANE